LPDSEALRTKTRELGGDMAILPDIADNIEIGGDEMVVVDRLFALRPHEAPVDPDFLHLKPVLEWVCVLVLEPPMAAGGA